MAAVILAYRETCAAKYEQLQTYENRLHECKLQYKIALHCAHVPAGCKAASARISAPVFLALQPEGQQITYATKNNQTTGTKNKNKPKWLRSSPKLKFTQSGPGLRGSWKDLSYLQLAGTAVARIDTNRTMRETKFTDNATLTKATEQRKHEAVQAQTSCVPSVGQRSRHAACCRKQTCTDCLPAGIAYLLRLLTAPSTTAIGVTGPENAAASGRCGGVLWPGAVWSGSVDRN